MTKAHWIELATITALASALMAAIPLSAGAWGFSWDALNHHIYLGLISERPRWHLDVAAASSQSWQYPYLYWPVYRLTLLAIDGATAGAIWSGLLTVLLVPPVWVTSFRLLPAQGTLMQAAFERFCAVVLALSSIVVLSSLGTTANDPLATVPLLWAIAIMSGVPAQASRATVAAALWGVSTAFKLSNVLAFPLLLVWWWGAQESPARLRRGAAMALGSAAGFCIVYLPWGWQLWQQTGNPFYPFLGGWFGS